MVFLLSFQKSAFRNSLKPLFKLNNEPYGKSTSTRPAIAPSILPGEATAEDER
jgi:hypothetical protein